MLIPPFDDTLHTTDTWLHSREEGVTLGIQKRVGYTGQDNMVLALCISYKILAIVFVHYTPTGLPWNSKPVLC